ncbi:MAG: hypothetical protein QOI46_540 [Alphaproteobacteria bacterium]|nr:hypothetical protein [Alphaproteobacteria bacterium]
MRGRRVGPGQREGPGEVDRRGLAPSLSAAKGRMPRETRRKVTVSPALSFRASREMPSGVVLSLPTTSVTRICCGPPEQTPSLSGTVQTVCEQDVLLSFVAHGPGFFPQTSSMPIRPHLDGQKFDPETIRVMGLAFEMALVALRLADRGDLANEVLARKIMDLAKAGERDPERLCEGVLHEFRAPPPQV